VIADNNLGKNMKKHNYSNDEWHLRTELACCYRLIDHFNMTDLVYNHITARLPNKVDGKEVFLINGWGLHYSEITASNLIKVDINGVPLEETEFPLNPAGYVIHSAIHSARPEVVCIIHTHSYAGSAVSALKDGLIPIDLQSLMFADGVAYHELEGIAVDLDERSRLIDDLGDQSVMILRNHGLLTVGKSVAQAFRKIYYLERACRLQLDVMRTGAKISLPSDEVSKHTAKQWDEGAAGQGVVDPIEWPSLYRLMERKDDTFKN
jgi:ribulose-5-phosphate 4-epimerase/fuculose-1-phosphate aldolase